MLNYVVLFFVALCLYQNSHCNCWPTSSTVDKNLLQSWGITIFWLDQLFNISLTNGECKLYNKTASLKFLRYSISTRCHITSLESCPPSLAGLCCTKTKKAKDACVDPSKSSGASLGCILTHYASSCSSWPLVSLRCFGHLTVNMHGARWGDSLSSRLICILLSSCGKFPVSDNKPKHYCSLPTSSFCFLSILMSVQKLSTWTVTSAILSNTREFSEPSEFFSFTLILFQNGIYNGYVAKPENPLCEHGHFNNLLKSIAPHNWPFPLSH